MNRYDLDTILQTARRAPQSPGAQRECSPPPGFARGVVHRWLRGAEQPWSENWATVSRRGLAVALGLMLVSLIWHARLDRGFVLMESTASDTVMLSLYPQ